VTYIFSLSFGVNLLLCVLVYSGVWESCWTGSELGWNEGLPWNVGNWFLIVRNLDDGGFSEGWTHLSVMSIIKIEDSLGLV
jgi:hypothetical protein